MKKLFAPIVITLLLSRQLFAQENEHKSRITAGVGFVTSQDVFSLISTLVIPEIILGTITPTSNDYIPAIYFEYSRFLNDKVRLDVLANYSNSKQKWVFSSDGSNAGTFTTDFYTLMVGAHYDWVKNARLIQLHSGLYLGGSLYAASSNIEGTTTSDDFAFAYQLDALGIRIGHQVAFELDLGLGYKGLVSAGVSAQF